jgi:hypothetical protein
VAPAGFDPGGPPAGLGNTPAAGMHDLDRPANLWHDPLAFRPRPTRSGMLAARLIGAAVGVLVALGTILFVLHYR